MNKKHQLFEMDQDFAKLEIVGKFRVFREYLKALLYAEKITIMPAMEMTFLPRQGSDEGGPSSPDLGNLAIKTSRGLIPMALRPDGMLIRPGDNVYGEGLRLEFLAHELMEDMKNYRYSVMCEIGVDAVKEEMTRQYGNYVRLEGFPQAEIA